MLQYNFLPPYRALIQLLFFYDVCTCIIRCTPQRINFNIIRTFPNKLHLFTNSKVIIAFSKKYYHILLLNNVLPPPPPPTQITQSSGIFSGEHSSKPP